MQGDFHDLHGQLTNSDNPMVYYGNSSVGKEEPMTDTPAND